MGISQIIERDSVCWAEPNKNEHLGRQFSFEPHTARCPTCSNCIRISFFIGTLGMKKPYFRQACPTGSETILGSPHHCPIPSPVSLLGPGLIVKRSFTCAVRDKMSNPGGYAPTSALCDVGEKFHPLGQKR